MDGVVDGVQAVLLGAGGQLELAVGGAVLTVHTPSQVGLSVSLHVGLQVLAQQLSKLGGVLGLLIGGLLPVQADLGIALAVSHAGHGQVHADLGALALEVLTQALDDLLGSALGHAHHVLGSPGAVAALEDELLLGGLADGAEVGGGVTLMHVTTDGANPLFHVSLPPKHIYHLFTLISLCREIVISNNYYF